MTNCTLEHEFTIIQYCRCLYSLKDCGTGGPLHIVLDDGNLTDHDIQFCLTECIKHPEWEESELGIIICRELLRLPMEDRNEIYDLFWGSMKISSSKRDLYLKLKKAVEGEVTVKFL